MCRNGHGDIYGYDEFGKDLFNRETNQYFSCKYTKQGQWQPYGYTRYRYDDISGTYFAQARKHQSSMGRFTAEDIIKGNRARPEMYQLTNHNCNQVAQLILEAGGRNFAPANFDWLDTRPNNVYRNMTEWIFENKPKGWRYGRLNMLRLGALYDEK